MENNIRLLPKWIPDEECKALIAWVDSLTIGQLQGLRNLHVEANSLRNMAESQNELATKYRKALEMIEVTWINAADKTHLILSFEAVIEIARAALEGDEK